jgi:hypothetical protein
MENNIVEIYFDQELSDIVFDSEKLEEWKKTCKELGLENQLKLSKGDDSPIPYPFMNTSMRRIASTLCPTNVEVGKYDKTPIPLEVIQQLALCKKEGYFQDIEVWYDDKSPDPFLIGLRCKFYSYQDGTRERKEFDTKEEAQKWTGENNSVYPTNVTHYLIARWGDVKKDFKRLKVEAKERFLEEYSSTMKNDIEVLQMKLKQIKDNANLYLSGSMSLNEATTQSKY